MSPTFAARELLLVDRTAYRDTGPCRGDIVVARHLGECITKRVVGLPGETVAVQDGRLLVEGLVWPEAYERLPGALQIGPGRLQPDRYALLGDNRSMSASQNLHAVVAREQILGRVIGSLRLSRRRVGGAADAEESGELSAVDSDLGSP